MGNKIKNQMRTETEIRAELREACLEHQKYCNVRRADPEMPWPDSSQALAASNAFRKIEILRWVLGECDLRGGHGAEFYEYIKSVK